MKWNYDNEKRFSFLSNGCRFVCEIEYKLLVFIFKSLNSLTPTYLDALVKYHTSARSLRSSDQQLWTVPRSRLKRKGDRHSQLLHRNCGISYLWYRSAPTISSFKSLLITYLLTQAYNISGCWVLCSLCLFCVVWCYFLCIFMKMFFFTVVQHIGQHWLY